MKQQINPIVGVLIAVAVLFGVGLLSMKLFSSDGKELAAPTIIAAPDRNDPKFRPDPNLGGGGG